GELPASSYERTTQVEDRGVYSFCMCPGGFVVPASTESSRVVVNGMSLSRRDSPFANAGVVVQLEPLDWCGTRGAAWGWDALAGGRPPRAPGGEPPFGGPVPAPLRRPAAAPGWRGN